MISSILCGLGFHFIKFFVFIHSVICSFINCLFAYLRPVCQRLLLAVENDSTGECDNVGGVNLKPTSSCHILSLVFMFCVNEGSGRWKTCVNLTKHNF